MAVSARDKKILLTLLEQAQLVYLLTRLPKKQVLDDPRDVARLEGSLAGMRAAASELSASLRDTHTAVQWDELAAKPEPRSPLATRQACRPAGAARAAAAARGRAGDRVHPRSDR